MKKIERTVFLDEDAAAILIQLAGGPRKQGEYLSNLLRQLARQEPLRAQLTRLEEELARLREAVGREEAQDGR